MICVKASSPTTMSYPRHNKGEGKVYPRTGHAGPEGEKRYSSTLSLTSALDGGKWSMPRPGRFTPGKDLVPTVKGAGWTSQPVHNCAENITPTGI